MIFIVGILVAIIIALLIYNITIHKKIQQFNNLNRQANNLRVLQDFLSTIGECSSVDEKIAQLVELKEKYGYEVMLDGACSPERVETLSKVGVKGFILGTSALFGKEKSYKEIVKELRSL